MNTLYETIVRLERKAKNGEEFAENKQLAEWLRNLKRADTLLKATYKLLNKQYESYYVLNLLAETVYYDEAECDGDCISRRVAKKKLEQNLAYMRAFGVDRCLELIDEIPAVETEPKWISCKEKMPEEDLWTGASQQYSFGVLMYVLDDDGEEMIDFGHTIDGKWYSDTADAYIENYSCRVIAWMLPPSYKENKR